MVGAESFTSGGDGGAPVLTEDNKLAGIVFAGSDQVTLILPIRAVLESLDVTLPP
jgi:hypothetical protein